MVKVETFLWSSREKTDCGTTRVRKLVVLPLGKRRWRETIRSVHITPGQLPDWIRLSDIRMMTSFNDRSCKVVVPSKSLDIQSGWLVETQACEKSWKRIFHPRKFTSLRDRSCAWVLVKYTRRGALKVMCMWIWSVPCYPDTSTHDSGTRDKSSYIVQQWWYSYSYTK